MLLQSLIQLVPFYLLSTCLIGLPQTSAQNNTGNILDDETEKFINQILLDWKSPGGVAIALVRRDEQGEWNVETKGYGRATASGRNVTENTLFNMASNSKV